MTDTTLTKLELLYKYQEIASVLNEMLAKHVERFNVTQLHYLQRIEQLEDEVRQLKSKVNKEEVLDD